MCAGPPATLDCKKRSNSRLSASRRRVDGLSATTFVNWASRCSMADLPMYNRAVSLSFELDILGATYHWQKWNALPFPPWYFKHRALARISDTRISVRGGLLIVVSRRPEWAYRTCPVVPPDGHKRCCRVVVGCGDRRQVRCMYLFGSERSRWVY